jgi:hypothetical protein
MEIVGTAKLVRVHAIYPGGWRRREMEVGLLFMLIF